MNKLMHDLDNSSGSNVEYHSELELRGINSECFAEFLHNLAHADQSSHVLSSYETAASLPSTRAITPAATTDIRSEFELRGADSECYVQFMLDLSPTVHSSPGLSACETTALLTPASDTNPMDEVDTSQNADVKSTTGTKEQSFVGSLMQRLMEVQREELVSGIRHDEGTSFMPLQSAEEPIEYLSSFMEVDDVLTIEDVTLSEFSIGSAFSHMMTGSPQTFNCAIGSSSSNAALNSPADAIRNPEVQKTKPVGTFPCDECDLVFRQSGNLRKHVDEIHRKRKPFACPECQSKFSRKHARDTHLRAVHHKLRPFQCSDCFKRYKNRSDLNKHVRTVERKEKPFMCKICNKGFGERGKLKRHMPVHDR